jgi:hypothetical protein
MRVSAKMKGKSRDSGDISGLKRKHRGPFPLRVKEADFERKAVLS